MNLRDFKKDVDYVVGEFVDDTARRVPLRESRKATENVEKVAEEAVDLYNDLKDRLNAKIEGKHVSFYNDSRWVDAREDGRSLR